MGLPCRSHRCAAPVPYPFSLVLFHVAVPLRSLFILRLIILSQFDYDVLNQTMGINGSKEVASPGSQSSPPARPHRSPTALRAASHSPREGVVPPRSTQSLQTLTGHELCASTQALLRGWAPSRRE